MPTTTVLEFTGANANDLALTSGLRAQEALKEIVNHLHGGMNGARSVTGFKVADTAVAATATITLASVAANTVLLINGVPFTATNGAATAGNNEFDISGGTDTLDATALAAAINASTTTGIAGVVTATSAAEVVTVTAVRSGRGGNAITIENLGVVATGTATAASVDATDAITLNGQAITAVASGAANNQFNVGATDAATAANLAAAINASTTAIVNKHVRAVSRAAVVHIFAKYGGIHGNAITLTTNDGTDLAVSGARLTGGTIAQWEGVQASQTTVVSGADGGTYATVINGVTINATGTNGNDTATAASIVTAINASTDALVRGHVTATSSAGTVTLTAVRGGHLGNAVTVSVTGTGYTATGARLVSGAVPTVAVIAGGLATQTGGGARLSSGSNDTQLAFTL